MSASSSTHSPATPESVFTYGAPQLKYGPGASDEIGYDLSLTGARRVLVVTDPGVAATGHPQRVADQMTQFGIEAQVFDGAHVGRDRRGGRRVEHRHRQGGQPAHHQPR
jgi:hydroxyacid-oxoacid transhydrogenase